MSDRIIKNFEEYIELNFHLYNSLFLTIPLESVVQTGMLIPILREQCEKGLADSKSPIDIIEEFLAKNKPNFDNRHRIDFLFNVIQYVERQILLIDALEDAAYDKIHRVDGPNTLVQLLQRVKDDHLEWKLRHFLSTFGIRVVLTAHPTQFYPGRVLAISADITKAVAAKENSLVRDLMHQLSKTPFFRKQKPTPFNEAQRLNWYLVNTFYPAISELLETLSNYYDQLELNDNLMSLGFWPGGDRDGNPFVKTETTLKVAEQLRANILSCYIDDLRLLKRRLSFVGVFERLEQLEDLLLLEQKRIGGDTVISYDEFLDQLSEIEQIIISKHESLFIDKMQLFKRKVKLFGYHFASLDIRQDSRIINKAISDVINSMPGILPDNYDDMSEDDKIRHLLSIEPLGILQSFEDELTSDTIESMKAMIQIQKSNGQKGCHRYIISNCKGALDISKVIALFRIAGYNKEQLNVDIVPLFETIDDLKGSGRSMENLYRNDLYRQHLQHRDNKQTVMLGFSDGTKDGGYLMANWSIYTAKEEITTSSRNAGIEVIFFDGRGGPPARGGGNTHHFYAALGNSIESKQLQLTLQGQTISSHYGIKEAVVHNLGYLLTAGLSNNIYNHPNRDISEDNRQLIDEMAKASLNVYENFKSHPLFIPFLEERSTLKYYGMANISSRPSKRKDDDKLVLDDLRAIPFVGAWSQLKQNVPGFYGLGSALKEQENKGNLIKCVDLYKESGFFRTLISNSMQSISKSNFMLTKYMQKDEKYGEFWKIIFDEFELTREMVLKVSGMVSMLEDNPRSRKSIALREKVVLPLLVVQQYALMKIQELSSGHKDEAHIYEKLVMRSLFGNINATRNAV